MGGRMGVNKKDLVMHIKREVDCNECNRKIHRNNSCYVIPIRSSGGYYLRFICLKCGKGAK